MSNYGKCKYCGSDLISDVYKKGKCKTPRLIVYCGNDDCSIKPCSDDNTPSLVMEEVKYFALLE